MVEVLAFVAFLVAVILDATEHVRWFLSGGGWIAVGLCLLALAGAWEFAGPRFRRRGPVSSPPPRDT